MNRTRCWLSGVALALALSACGEGDQSHISPPVDPPHLSVVGEGWSGSSINATIFRRNSLVSHGDHQFIAYYDAESRVTLARRQLGSDLWQRHTTAFRGNTADAHNSISLMIDGDGFLHVAWDHHGDPLNYAVGLEPGELALGPREPMLSVDEQRVTYPEFYRLNDGDLMFAYRDGSSGRGRLILNRYITASREWQRLQTGLIDGERERNPYWQLHVDEAGRIHVSWVWRETSDVATNHDMSYARSDDGGESWQRSDGTPFPLPIRMSDAGLVWTIPEASNLINQTSMTADQAGNPYIATYFRDDSSRITQIRVLYREDGRWRDSVVSRRVEDFELAGGGTKSLPVSRPQILIDDDATGRRLYVVYRDAAEDDRAVLASAVMREGEWQWSHRPLTSISMNRWEPSFDTERWRTHRELFLFHQPVSQISDVESEALAPTPVSVLDVDLD